jgi:hypothetical protein
MLVGVYRDGPLRSGLGKGYVLVADQPARVMETVARDTSLVSALELHRMRIRTDPRRPAAVWIDTGPVWLSDQQARTTTLKALAHIISELAAAAGRSGAALVPSAFKGSAPDRWSWLCEDRHSVEIVNQRQREICSNLFRRWVPVLVALTGRAAFGGHLADPHGSRRLADASDQVPARYIASASEMHLERVRQALRRDEGVPRLDVMDIDPLGDDGAGMPNVIVRCVDAQAFPATALSHAVLLQALAMRARRTEKEGRREPAIPQPMLDRNRSRAVASGLSAAFEEEKGRDARAAAPTVFRTAADVVMSLIRSLLPELRAMEVSAAELMPAIAGVSLRNSYPDAVRTENDLFVNQRHLNGDALDTAALHTLLSSQKVLLTDQITAANARITAGGTAVVAAFWSDLLRREAGDERGGSGGGAREERHTLAEATLVTALLEAGTREAAIAAVARHLAAGGRPTLVPALRQADGQDAKQVRRALRPAAAAVLRLRDNTDIPGQLGPAVRAAVARDGDAFIALDVPPDDRDRAIAAVAELRRSLPPIVATVLVTNAAYQNHAGRRVSLEALVFDTRGRA